jgi:intracellular septation protein A
MNNAAKPNPLFELSITLIIPSFILMKLSGSEDLGTVNALLLALTFPLLWGVRSLLRERKVNLLAVLGLVSILLTGGIGLLQLDTHWLAVKEAAIPGLIGLVVVISAFTISGVTR